MMTVDWDQNIIIEQWELSLLYATLNKQVVLHFNYHYSCLWINFCGPVAQYTLLLYPYSMSCT